MILRTWTLSYKFQLYPPTYPQLRPRLGGRRARGLGFSSHCGAAAGTRCHLRSLGFVASPGRLISVSKPLDPVLQLCVDKNNFINLGPRPSQWKIFYPAPLGGVLRVSEMEMLQPPLLRKRDFFLSRLFKLSISWLEVQLLRVHCSS